MKYLIYLFVLIAGYACSPDSGRIVPEAGTISKDSAEWIIARAIIRHGGEYIQNSRVSFNFRDRHYIAEREEGQFTYERIWKDTADINYRDVLTNATLFREKNGQRVSLSSKDSAAYANSINSVIYFALLPYFLQDPAVRKTYLGKSKIKDQDYYKIKVTFKQEGGGKDFDDNYIYWIHPDLFTMDYFAYNYQVDGGGARFREAYNIREIEGIRFADYINYQPIPDTQVVERFDSIFSAGNMQELSRINSEDIAVSLK